MAFPLAKLLLLTALLPQVAGIRQTQTGSVRGQLLSSSGTPVDGVRVAVESVESDLGAGVLESIGLTDKDGRFLLENITPGRYRLVFGRISSPTYYPGVTKAAEATAIVVVAGPVTDVPNMLLKTTRVSGRVVDIKTERGRAVQSLILCCDPGVTGGIQSSDRIDTLPMRATVREDGSFVLPAVSPGEYYFQAVDPEVVPVAQAITVGRDNLENVEVRITSGASVEGQILDRLKQAVASVNVTLTAHPSNPVVRSGSPLTGVSLLRIGPFTTPVTALLTTAISRMAVNDKPQMITATSAGTFAFPGVLPGKYTLEMNAAGGNAFSREIEVGIREPLNVTLDVPFTQLTGRIVVNNGAPLPKIAGSVRFVSQDPDGRILFAFPDDSGRFSVLMASGEYRIFADGLNVSRDIESISYGTSALEDRRLFFDEARLQEIRITIAP